MRSIQFSGFKTQPWGNVKILYDDSSFKKLNEDLKKVDSPTNAPPNTVILLHTFDGQDVVSISVNNKVEKGISTPETKKESGNVELLKLISKYFKDRA